MEYLSCFFLLFIAASFFKFSNKIYGNYFSPLSIQGFIWFFSLGLYSLKIIDYDNLSIKTWAIIIGSFVCFSIGSLFITIIFKIKNKNFFSKIDEKKLLRVIYFLFFIGLIGFLVNVNDIFRRYGLSGIIESWRYVRGEFGVNFFELPFSMNILNVPLSFLYINLFKKKRIRVFIIMAFSLLVLPLAFQKTNFIKAIVLTFFVYVLIKEKVSTIKPFIITICVCLLFFITYWIFSYQRDPYTYYVQNLGFKIPNKILAYLSQPYTYLSASFPTFQALTEDNAGLEIYRKNYPIGFEVFNPIYYMLSKFDNSITSERFLSEVYYIPIGFNVYTYLGNIYKDFGVIGTLIIPFFIGFVSTLIYLKVVKNGQLAYAFPYSIICWCIFITFFSNHFFYLNNWYFFLILFLIGKYVVRNHKLKNV